MPKTSKRAKKAKNFTALFIKSAPEGMHSDGGCATLNLRVTPTGSRSFVQRLRIDGKQCWLGLGTFPAVSLQEARRQATINRDIARGGGDPRTAATPTFSQAAETYIGEQESTWRNGSKSAGQWKASLRDYAFPAIGDKQVGEITAKDVIACLKRETDGQMLWLAKPETARRVLQRIGAIMKWCVANELRADNPAASVKAALPRHSKNGREHHAALPHSKVGGAIATIRETHAWPQTKLCLEFAILAAARSGEARLATWREIEGDTWTIPGERMKAGNEHKVPLSDRAQEILAEALEHSDGSGLVFPSPTGKPMSDSTLSKLVRENEIGCVPHGFRSSFRNWCAENRKPYDQAEIALAHELPDIVRAYLRTDLLEERRKLMQEWADYLQEK